MANTIVVHPITQQTLQRHAHRNTHNLLLLGPAGSGKTSLAQQFAAQRHAVDVDKLQGLAYLLHIKPDDKGSISIDIVRTIEHFLSRRLPKGARRTVIIQDASTLSIEAQNALLKMLEEPPANTVFVLTADSTTNVIPTVQSRMAVLHVLRPDMAALRNHFTALDHDKAAVQRAELMSGGLPGLMHTLLTADSDHPLMQAAAAARDCVQKSSFERLCLVDSLAKDRQLSLDTMFMLQQMAHVSLATGNSNPIWTTVLTAAYAASQELQQSAQPKLVLTNLMLALTV